MATIGVGIITCNREDYFRNCYNSLPHDLIDHIVVVNDGKPINCDIHKGEWLQNEVNLGVAKSKNKALKHLYKKGCDYLFLIEDDMLILKREVFDEYVKASQISGIQHFNYGPGSPFNRVQTIKDFDLHNRHLLDQHSPPNPKAIVCFSPTCTISLFEHTVAMFSMFTRKVIEEVGYIDENFFNAWEHVAHTYDIIRAGMHPPFWWFADIDKSHHYMTEAPGAIDNSSIANKKEQWTKNVMEGREYYKKKYGHYPNQPPYSSKTEVVASMLAIRDKYAIKNSV